MAKFIAVDHRGRKTECANREHAERVAGPHGKVIVQNPVPRPYRGQHRPPWYSGLDETDAQYGERLARIHKGDEFERQNREARNAWHATAEGQAYLAAKAADDARRAKEFAAKWAKEKRLAAKERKATRDAGRVPNPGGARQRARGVRAKSRYVDREVQIVDGTLSPGWHHAREMGFAADFRKDAANAPRKKPSDSTLAQTRESYIASAKEAIADAAQYRPRLPNPGGAKQRARGTRSHGTATVALDGGLFSAGGMHASALEAAARARRNLKAGKQSREKEEHRRALARAGRNRPRLPNPDPRIRVGVGITAIVEYFDGSDGWNRKGYSWSIPATSGVASESFETKRDALVDLRQALEEAIAEGMGEFDLAALNKVLGPKLNPSSGARQRGRDVRDYRNIYPSRSGQHAQWLTAAGRFRAQGDVGSHAAALHYAEAVRAPMPNPSNAEKNSLKAMEGTVSWIVKQKGQGAAAVFDGYWFPFRSEAAAKSFAAWAQEKSGVPFFAGAWVDRPDYRTEKWLATTRVDRVRNPSGAKQRARGVRSFEGPRGFVTLPVNAAAANARAITRASEYRKVKGPTAPHAEVRAAHGRLLAHAKRARSVNPESRLNRAPTLYCDTANGDRMTIARFHETAGNYGHNVAGLMFVDYEPATLRIKGRQRIRLSKHSDAVDYAGLSPAPARLLRAASQHDLSTIIS